MERRDLTVRLVGVGEMLDQAVALWRRHFRALFLVTLAIEAPLLLVARGQVMRANELILAAGADPARIASASRLLLPAVATGLFMGLAQLWITAAAALVVAPSLQGGSPARWRTVLHRVPAILSASAVHLFALVALPALAAAPGLLLAAVAAPGSVLPVAAVLLAAAAAFLALLAALLLTLVAPAAAGVEGVGGLRAVLRSARLMRAEPGGGWHERPGVQASLLLLAVFAITLAVNALAGVPRAAASAALAPGRLGAGLPWAAEVAVGGFEVLAVAALRPFGLCGLAVFYFVRRARREGLDLEIWARGLAAPPGTP